jgi:hypothetical protein
MTEFFDVLSVMCFLAVAVAFLVYSDRDIRTLLSVSICGVVFAVGNHLGNKGWSVFALLLIAAGAGYGWLVITMRDGRERRDG